MNFAFELKSYITSSNKIEKKIKPKNRHYWHKRITQSSVKEPLASSFGAIRIQFWANCTNIYPLLCPLVNLAFVKAITKVCPKFTKFMTVQTVLRNGLSLKLGIVNLNSPYGTLLKQMQSKGLMAKVQKFILSFLSLLISRFTSWYIKSFTCAGFRGCRLPFIWNKPEAFCWSI